MDEGESFDYDLDEFLEENDDEEDFESEDAQIKAYESDTEEIVQKTDALVKLNTELVELNAKFEEHEIPFQTYNETLIYIQRMIVEEKLRRSEISEHTDLSKGLIKEIGSMFLQLTSEKYTDKFDPSLVEMTIDDVFRKYGELLEKQHIEENEFIFESNPITSSISNVINLPVPEKYQKQLQAFEQRIAKNDISIEDIYAYLDLRLNILTENLKKNLKYDVFYINFQMDLQLEFTNLKSELELLIGETSVVLDEDMTEFNKKHGITPGVLKNRRDLFNNVNLLKEILELKINNLVNKYSSIQETVFKKQDSREILRVIKQLREIYIKNKYRKLERKFTDEEIINDLKNKPLDFIVEKYAEYVESDYFDWAAKKSENIYERPKYQKKVKISEKEKELLRESEIKDYKQRKEFEKILSTLPRDILLKCADRLIAEGKIREPSAEASPQEAYINRLYSDSIRVMTLSTYHPQTIMNYAKEVNRMADEFMLDKHIIEANWRTGAGSRIEVGDVVYVDRTNELVLKTIKEMENIQKQLNSFDQKNEVLVDKLAALDKQLKSYNSYLRAPQIKGTAVKISSDKIDVKIEGTTHVKSFPTVYVSRSLKRGEIMPLYNIVESNAFNPAAPLKVTSMFAISRWITAVLKRVTIDATNKEQLSELYDKALEVYYELSETEKSVIDNKVMSSMPEQYKSQFENGIPSKGPLVFKFPPKLPVVPDKEDANLEEFVDYSNKLQEYVQNLTPETNPYVKIGIPVTNQLVFDTNKKTYPDLLTAIKNTPINGFFKLKNISDFKSLVFDLMSEKDKKSLQMMVLSQDEIKDFMEVYFLSDNKEESKADDSTNFFSNAKMNMIIDLKTITEQNEYIKTVNKIDKGIKIEKVIGEEVFIEGRQQPILKASLEKSLISSVSTKRIGGRIMTERDPLISSIEWGLSRNPTFQLLDLSKRLPGTIIVHTEPKYRIKVVSGKGRFYTGWTINPIEKIEDKRMIYKYKYPIIITDFTEYLKAYRSSLFIRYEGFRQLDVLSYEELTSSNYLLKNIQYITEYLKNIGKDDGFTIEMIKQQDVYLKIRQEQRHELLQALTFMYGNIVNTEELRDIANVIEFVVYDSFKDIRQGTSYKQTHVLTSGQVNDFELLLRFKKSGLPFGYVSRALYSSGNRTTLYESYLYRMSIAVFNIYRTNNFVQNYIEGKIDVNSLIYRDLTKEEMMEGPDTIEKLVKWTPPTKVLNEMRTFNPDVYDNVIKNGELVDISLIDQFEQIGGKKMSFLNKKLALIELVRIRTWNKVLSGLNSVKESKRLMYLIQNRNAIRAINNITADIRLNTVGSLRMIISNCKIVNNDDLIDQYAENIENACYSLSGNKEEYQKIVGDITSAKPKLCKLISVFSAGNAGPVDIVANIAELYLDIGKTASSSLKKAKLGDWNGIKELPNEILIGIKKVANSMTEIHTRFNKTDTQFKQDNEGKFYALTKIIKEDEYKVHKDSEEKYIIKKIEKPYIIDKKKQQMHMFLQIVKHDYVPRINDILSSEIQQVIDKNDLTETVLEELNSREGLNSKDIEKLKSLTYDQLLDINANIYREPTFVDIIPMSMAKSGIRVFPIKKRGGFLIGGNFPMDPKAYRHRDSEGKIRTKLIDICEMVGMVFKTTDIEYPSVIKSIYSSDILPFEESMMSCVKKLVDSYILIKIRGEELIESKEVLSKIIDSFDMFKQIEESCIKYFKEFGGNFANGGTKEEFDSLLTNALYAEAMQKVLGIQTLVEKKIHNHINMPLDDRVEVSILKNGNEVIYRKLYKSKNQTYPVPIRYDQNNYPVYSKYHKLLLASLIESGHISPWYKNKIKVSKVKGEIEFEGDLPFVIDETSNETSQSDHYVEQTFKDPMYGLPIVTRIGIHPKRIEGAEGSNMIKKIKLPENRFVIKEEPFKIKYFRSEIPAQSQVNDFRLSRAQESHGLVASDLMKKSGYSIIDSRMLSYSVKYTPDDVWSWDPMTDYKVGAEKDNDIWVNEKNKQMMDLKGWLKKAGSSSSAFIAAKNEATRYLQWFRLNLPSQKRNELTQTRFKKPAKTAKEISILKIGKAWKKLTKSDLINEAKRIGFYTNDMNTLQAGEILSKMKSKLDQEIKINAQIIEMIGVKDTNKIELVEQAKTHRRITEISEYARYIDLCIKNDFLVISPNVMRIIENPMILFPNYNRYEVGFNENGNVQFSSKYDSSGPRAPETVTETIYEIIRNMSYTTTYGFNQAIVKYINNISAFEALDKQEQIKLITQFPIMKLFLKIKQKGQRITIWNILTTACDVWIPSMHRGVNIENIKRKTLKYSLESPIEITMEDVVNYLGDSYYQNSKYGKGIIYEEIANKYTGHILYLQPGYKFEKIVADEVSFTDEKSFSMKYVHNPYVTLFRNIDDKNPRISVEMLVVGDDLHNNKIAVSSNLGRRAALLYNVDPSIVNPLFSIPDPNISGKFREIAIAKDDVFKFLEKGGNQFTILEMPDAELKFRKLPIGEKDKVIKTYRNAVREYFKSNDPKSTYQDLLKRKRMNILTLNLYINKVQNAKIPQTHLMQYIDSMSILPDFLDTKWPSRKKILETEFLKKVSVDSELLQQRQILREKLSKSKNDREQIAEEIVELDDKIKQLSESNREMLNNFLNGEKRGIYINVSRPTQLLYQ